MARGNQVVATEQPILKRGRKRAYLGGSWAAPAPDADVLRQAAVVAQQLDLGGSSDDANQRRALQILQRHSQFLDPVNSPPALQTVFDALLRRMTIDRRLTWVPMCVRIGLRLQEAETREVVSEPAGELHLRHPYSTVTLCGAQMGSEWKEAKPVGMFGWARANQGEFSAPRVCETCALKGKEKQLASASVSWDAPVYGEEALARFEQACRDELLRRIVDGPQLGDDLVDELEWQIERALTDALAPLVADEILKRGVDWIRNEWFVKEPGGTLIRRAENHRYSQLWDHSYLYRHEDVKLLPKISRPRKKLLVETLTSVFEKEIPLDSFELAKEQWLLTHALLPQLTYAAWPEVTRAILDPRIENQQMPLESAAVFVRLQQRDSAAEHPFWPSN